MFNLYYIVIIYYYSEINKSEVDGYLNKHL